MSRDEVRTRVLRLLRVPTRPICDKCIELALGYAFDTVNHVNREFVKDGTIIRYKGNCALCGDTKLVNVNGHRT